MCCELEKVDNQWVVVKTEGSQPRRLDFVYQSLT